MILTRIQKTLTTVKKPTTKSLTKTKKTTFSLEQNLHKLVTDLTSDEYHGVPGTWSSSQFKEILEDEENFIKKYVTKEIPRAERDVFDTGNYFHISILEPHKIKEDIAFFEGKIKSGNKWKEFEKDNKGRIIITSKQKAEGDHMVKLVNNSPVALEHLVGTAEISLFVRLVVHVEEGNIYAPEFKKVLTRNGWQDFKGRIGPGYEIVVKVRADKLGETFISDLKSTRGNPRLKKEAQKTISKWQYDLSAALYLDMFFLVRPSLEKFVWIFASKDCHSCKSWEADEEQILIGRSKYMEGILKLARLAKAKWKVVDSLGKLPPLPHEREWIRDRKL